MIKVKGVFCLGLGALFTFTALMILIFVHVGQVNPGKVPSSISMVTMNVSALGLALQQATGDPSRGLYNADNRSIGINQGLQYTYSWGLYSVCGYFSNASFDGGGGCANSSIAYAFTPFDVILNDTPSRYNTPVTFFISNSPGVETFTNSGYFTTFTNVAYYLILIATIATAVALIVGVWRYTATFVISTLLVVLAAIFLLISSILWQTVISQAKSINEVRSSQNIPVGITIQQGNAPYMLWAAFAFLVASIIPYGISCCTYRRY